MFNRGSSSSWPNFFLTFRELLTKFFNDQIEVFTAADNSVVGPNDRTGILARVGPDFIELIPTEDAEGRRVFFRIDEIIGFQTVPPETNGS